MSRFRTRASWALRRSGLLAVTLIATVWALSLRWEARAGIGRTLVEAAEGSIDLTLWKPDPLFGGEPPFGRTDLPSITASRSAPRWRIAHRWGHAGVGLVRGLH